VNRHYHKKSQKTGISVLDLKSAIQGKPVEEILAMDKYINLSQEQKDLFSKTNKTLVNVRQYLMKNL